MDYTIRGAAKDAGTKIDAEGRSWIEVMPVVENGQNGGKKFTITPEDLQAAADFIAASPERIPVDYDHAGAEGGSSVAAGWFTGKARVLDGEILAAEVKWTPQAQQEIRDGRFRFISPEWTMKSRDEKTGLLTKFKALLAATLTNRPYFTDLAAVTARELLDSTDLDALDSLYGAGASRLLLALRAQREQDLAAKTDAPSGDDPTTGDQVDLPELATKLGLAEDADQDAITAKLDELTKPIDPDPAPKTPAADDPKDEPVAETTDYLTALKLKPDSEQSIKVAAALNEKDEKIVALTQQVSDLTAKNAEAEQLRGDIEELKAKDRKRDIDVVLAKAVENGQIMTAEKEAMADLFSDNVSGLKTLIATRPAGAFARKATGSGRDAERYADDVEVDSFIKANIKGDDPTDTESAKAHLRATKALADRGVKESDPDYLNQYLGAVEQANVELAAL